MNVEEESWERFGHFPKPLTPLYISYLLPTVERGHARMFEEYSLLAKGLGFRAYKGRIYVALKPPIKWLRRPPPESLMWVWRFLPSIRRRVKNCILHVQHGKPWQMLQLWKGEWIHQAQKELGDLKRIELEDLSDEDLIRHLDYVVELSREYFSMHVVLHGATAFSSGEFSSLAKRLLNWDDVKVYKAFTGLPGKPFEASKKLAEIAKVLTSESELKDVLWNSSPKEVLDRILDSPYAAGVMLKEYLDEYGWRLTSLAYDFAEPTFLESPELIVDALRDYLEHDYDVYGKLQWLRTEREKFVASALNEIHSGSDRRTFVEVLKKAEEAYKITDENNHYLVLVPLGILRYVILELGRRLRERDCIPAEADVFYLTLDEIRKALTKPRNFSGLVEDRGKEFDDNGTEEPPQTIGKPMEFPKLRSLPKIVQQVHAYMVDYFDKLVRPSMSSEQSALELRGQAASKGFYSGRAVVVHSENEFRKVMHGDVLVCPITTPAWSILLPKIGALVTDSGGVLSHPAITAREYGIPAVVGTGKATNLIRDGQIVSVDGDVGLVKMG